MPWRSVGYVQHVEVEKLQSCAERANAHIRVTALPGTFAAPGRPLAYIASATGEVSGSDRKSIEKAFLIGDERVFDDAFTPIARDGAGNIEVGVRMLKALHSLASAGHDRMRELAMQHARLALARAEIALDLEEDREAARDAAGFAISAW